MQLDQATRRILAGFLRPAADGFEEGKHPRGQPKNAGQFGPGGGGGGASKPKRQKVDWASINRGTGIATSASNATPTTPPAASTIPQNNAPLTSTERQELKDYSGETFSIVNNYLRTGMASPDAPIDPKESVQFLDKAIAKSSLDKAANLYRGVDEATARKLLSQKIGSTISDKGFPSFSKDRNIADDFGRGGITLQLYAPKGTNALDMSSISVKPEEQEVLLPRNTQFQIVHWDAGSRTLAISKSTKAADSWEESKHHRSENGQFGAGGSSAKNEKTTRFRKDTPLPDELNGVPFKPFKPPADWSDVGGQVPDLEEPEIEADEDLRISAGLLIEEPDGRVWIVKPKNKFGDYRFTFPKGGQEDSLSLQATAIKETWEESGIKAKITGFAGDYKGDTSVTRYYTAAREGGQPTDYDEEETEGVYLVSKARLREFLNRSRDRKIAAEHLAGDAGFEEGKHPRGQPGNAGQFGSVSVPHDLSRGSSETRTDSTHLTGRTGSPALKHNLGNGLEALTSTEGPHWLFHDTSGYSPEVISHGEGQGSFNKALERLHGKSRLPTRKAIQQVLQPAAPKASRVERDAIKLYVGSEKHGLGAFQKINQLLRSGKTDPQADIIAGYLGRASLPDDTLVERKVYGDYATSLLNAKTGDEFEEQAFTSTGARPVPDDPREKGKVTLHIDLPKGSPAAYIAQFTSQRDAERLPLVRDEVLIQRGAKYKVMSVDPEDRIVRLALVNDRDHAQDAMRRTLVSFLRPAADAEFQEGKHPRGQPGNAGQFGPGGGGTTKPTSEGKDPRTLNKLGFTKTSDSAHSKEYKGQMGKLTLMPDGTWHFQSSSTMYSLPSLKESYEEYSDKRDRAEEDYASLSAKVKANVKLTKDEVSAIKTYGKGTWFYESFNETARNGKLDAEQQKFSGDLKSAVAKSPLPQDKKLLRGVKNINRVFGTNDLSELKIGTVFQDPAPTSTTTDQFTAQRYMSVSSNKKFTDWDQGLIVIDAPKGSHALPLGSYVGKKAAQDQEFLLPPGQKFEVTGIFKVDDPSNMSEVPQVHVRLISDERAAKDFAADAPLDAAGWEETKHPRGKGGKFAKKGEVSNSVAVPLHSHGFKIAKGEANAHYGHSAGHKVSIHSVPEGKKYSSGWTHEFGGEPATTGQGGTSLALHLKKLLGEPEPKKVSPTETGEAGEIVPKVKAAKAVKPPPSFTNPNPNFQALVETYGLTPVKESTASQIYAGPAGAEVKLGSKPKGGWHQNWHWAVTKPGKEPIKGKNPNGLSNQLKQLKVKQDWLDAGGVPVSPPAGGGAGEDSTGYLGNEIEKIKKYTYGDQSVLVSQEGPAWTIKGKPPWPGATYYTTVASGSGQDDLNAAAEKHGLKAPQIKPPGAKGEPIGLGYSKILDANAEVWNAPDGDKVAVAIPEGPKAGQWAIFDATGKTKAQGSGQADLNTAFEALHPRGAGGKFIAKPNPPDDQVEHYDPGFAAVLNKAGAKFIGKDAHPLGSNTYEIPGPDGTITVRAINGNYPNFGLWLGGLGGQPLTKGASKGAVSLEDALHDAGILLATPGTPTPQLPSHLKPPVDTTKLKQVGPQLGSNPGGQYEDDAGQKFYVKKTPDVEHARNENLAAKLYQLAGVQTLPYRASTDPKEVVTEMVPLQQKNVSGLNDAQKKQAQQDFAVHAWLANWDAVGMGGDNVGALNGKPITLDVGGSLAYRAKGAPKGELFGNMVGEWDTLRSSKNPDAQKLFGSMSSAELKASAERLKTITPGQIGLALTAAGYTGTEAAQLQAKLVARRQDILQKGNAAGQPPPPPPPPEFKEPFTNTHHGSMSQLNAAAPDFASGEKGSVTTYTGGTYSQINRALRYGYHAGTHPQAENIKNITSWLDKASLPERVVVNRRVDGDYGSFLREMASGGPGTEWTDFGFTSTSTNPGAWSGQVKMVVDMPKGAKAASVKHVSHHSSEDEVLVQRGSRYKLVAFNPKTSTLYCTLDQSHLVKTEAL